MDIPQPNNPQQKAELLNLKKMEDERIEREMALADLRNENFSMLHEDEPAATWIKYVPIVSAVLDVAIIIILFVVKK